MYMLSEGLTYDIANIAHPLLFSVTYVGTKKIIEDYVAEVSEGLAYCFGTVRMLNRAGKIAFFKQSQKALGCRR